MRYAVFGCKPFNKAKTDLFADARIVGKVLIETLNGLLGASCQV
jgi:hypothetical protein